MSFQKALVFVFTSIMLSACFHEKVPRKYFPRTDHEAYRVSLIKANLLNTSLGEIWDSTAQKIFSNHHEVPFPYQEVFRIDEREPAAAGYRFSVNRGQRVVINLKSSKETTTRIFMDLFRVESDSLSKYRQVASSDSLNVLAFEPRSEAAYVSRIQPELLRGGIFELTIENVSTLGFPVAGKDKKAIQSFFGDSRDGGRRDHHGVDIFAKRHTPIIAPTDGYIRFAGTRGIGGKVVWLYDNKRRQSLYFAHLQDHKVVKGINVKKGDTLGTVGNTGNARTTPPHLHFGIYSNGPINPYDHIVGRFKKPGALTDLSHVLGDTILLGDNRLALHLVGGNPEPIDTSDTALVLAYSDEFLRVKTIDEKEGFVDLKSLNFN